MIPVNEQITNSKQKTVNEQITDNELITIDEQITNEYTKREKDKRENRRTKCMNVWMYECMNMISKIIELKEKG